MSTCDSLISPEFDYVENEDALVVKSDREEGKQQSAQSGHAQKEGKVCQRNILLEMGPNENADGFDKTSTDPQFFAPVARDIYMNPRASEVPCVSKVAKKKETSTCTKDNVSLEETMSTWDSLISPEFDYVENEDVLVVKSDREEGKQQSAQSGHAQKEGVAIGKRLIVVNLAIQYLVAYGWYRQQLQLLGVNACMMIAFKYVERYLQCSSSGRVLCKDEILQMESAVLNYLEL
ncbi:hypothetical protein CCACVL1_29448 [Corchorus capsularis]|uniref:Cyclin N-terminal domain-containing protein n=1 Tax=Corchorus capsularis TaxID=210143 RepID=A0A1R3G1P8_COCAP|nr:hypothetical protein CCACVL1_29448 [Corchorus capsularis]